MDKLWTTKDVFFDLAIVNKYFCRKYLMMIFVDDTAKKKNSKIGDIVIKQYGDKTVVSKYPDMSNIIPSDSQKQKRSRFAEAVAYAKTINNSLILRNDLLKRQDSSMLFLKLFRSAIGRCESCGGAARLKCSKCTAARYCSQECRRDDWSMHKHLCRTYDLENLKKRLNKLVRSLEFRTFDYLIKIA